MYIEFLNKILPLQNMIAFFICLAFILFFFILIYLDLFGIYLNLWEE